MIDEEMPLGGEGACEILYFTLLDSGPEPQHPVPYCLASET